MSHYPVLDRVPDPAGLKKLPLGELPELCSDIRRFLLDNISETGGHLASNLGVVELTVALHLEYDTTCDRIVFDVGHQCYVHKLLTSRRDGFRGLRRLDGMSGFPRPGESIHDAFIAGHASTSISAATGMARARTLLGDDYSVAAVIGDGALSGGMAYEALNDAGRSGEPMVVILNDNDMSISKSVGALANYLAKLRLRPSYTKSKQAVKNFFSKIPGGRKLTRAAHNIKQRIKNFILPGNIFENMGFLYIGPADGHNVGEVQRLIRYAREQKCPVLIHLKTVKGKGYRFSQEHPDTFHGTSGFDMATGKPVTSALYNFSDIFGDEMCRIADIEPRLCAVTAAMPNGTGLSRFAERFPSRFIDVGIAEEHAVTMAAGMAKQGMIPVCAVYSTFLQRAYDQIIHDVCIESLHVVFAVDRAGISGEDGETHQGTFDAAFLCGIPNMTVLCPSNERELRAALQRAVSRETGPVAVRYPRGHSGAFRDNYMDAPAALVRQDDNPKVTLVSYGTLINNALSAADILAEQGTPCEVIKLAEIKPLNLEPIRESALRTGALVTIEDCVAEGSVGGRITASLSGIAAIKIITAGDGFLRCGSIAELQAELGLDAKSIAAAAVKLLTVGNGLNRSEM